MSRPAGIVIVGAGGIAAAHAAAIAASSTCDVRAVVDVDVERATALAAPAGAAAFAALADIPARAGLDIAIVCTPPATHEAIVTEALARGLHVLCEKPFTVGGASARRMAEAALQSRRTLTLAAKFRYVDDVKTARAMVRDGAIGTVVGFDVTFASAVDMTQRWNAVPAVSGGGVLIDNGSHALDLVRYVLGPVGAVQASFPSPVQPIAVEDTAQLAVRMRDGAMGTVNLSWSVTRETPAFLTLFGTAGTIEVGWKLSRLRDRSGSWSVFGSGYDKNAAFRAQIETFAAAVTNGAPLPSALADAVAAVEAVDAAYRSEIEQRWLPVTGTVPATEAA